MWFASQNMKIFLMLSLLKLGLVALYIYIQNVHQAKDLEVLKQSIIARDKEDGKQYEEDMASQKRWQIWYWIWLTKHYLLLKNSTAKWSKVWNIYYHHNWKMKQWYWWYFPLNKNKRPRQNILSNWIHLAKEHNIRYFLTARSLLGA